MLAAPRVLAAEPAESARVVYTADDPACPTGADFVESVRVRLARGHVVDAQGPEARDYRADVRSADGRFVARLTFDDRSGVTRSREVNAATCADVSRAIALVTALAIDAGGVDVDREASAEGPPATEETPETALPLPEPAPLSPAPAVRDRVEPRPAKKSRRLPPEREAGVRATLTTPKGPTLFLGAELFAAMRDARGRWTFELGLAGERGFRDTSGSGSTEFSFAGGRVRVCGSALRLGARFEARPCLSFEGGALVAEGKIEHPNTRVDVWLAGGAAWRLGYRVPGGGLYAEAGPLVPIIRYRYVFETVNGPDTLAHQVPRFGVQLAVGGALRIF